MFSVLLIGLQLYGSIGRGAAQDSSSYHVLLRFPVTDTTSLFEPVLAAPCWSKCAAKWMLMASLAAGDIAVVRQPTGPESRNLLYHSWAWHGPYPTDLFAWIHEEGYYPDERILPVYDYPYELRLRCEACVTAKTIRGVSLPRGRWRWVGAAFGTPCAAAPTSACSRQARLRLPPMKTTHSCGRWNVGWCGRASRLQLMRRSLGVTAGSRWIPTNHAHLRSV